MTTEKIIARGAEAVIILEKNKNKEVIKRRIKKSYRLPQIDEQIRKLRTRNEAKLMEKAGKIIPTPKIFKADEKTKEIILEFIDGKKLSEHLDNFSLKEQKEICKQIGESIGKLHDAGIIHGDLTTSNMIYAEDDKKLTNNNSRMAEGERSAGGRGGFNFKIFFIDFGLAFHSPKFEDKAVDLHLLKQALEAKHFKHWEVLFKEVEKGYKKTSKSSEQTLKQLEKVEKRGRYKEH